jgi:hypothetical protein
VEISVTPAANAHADGDALGGRLDFTGAVYEAPTKGGVILNVTLIHMSTDTFDADLFVFGDVFTATADDSPFSPSDPDIINKLLGIVKVRTTDFVVTANHAVATVSANLAVQTTAPGTIYAQWAGRTAFTPAAITTKLGLLKD